MRVWTGEMLDLFRCFKCHLCSKKYPTKFDRRGQLLHGPHVECNLHGALWERSEIPDGCPFVLEHLLMNEEAENEASRTEEFAGDRGPVTGL